MRRKLSAADDRSESPTELIARVSAEHGSPTVTTGRHHRRTLVPRVAPGWRPRRTLARRLAPLAVGAAVMLVVTTIVAVVRPSDGLPPAAPELSAALEVSDAPVRRVAPAAPTPSLTPTPVPTTGATAAAAVRKRTTTPTTAHRPAQTTPKKKTKKKVPAPAAPAPAGSGGDGRQAAEAQGWTLVGGDEFTGSKSSKWGVYEGPGHDGKGRRTASAISVENGSLVIRGDANGNTGGMAWTDDQRFGKWEMRAKFPRGDAQYHPVLLLWPNGPWPAGGEVDFAETTSASTDVSFFLHYSASNQQKYAKKTLDITQWHNYAVEWVDGRITGYIDGQQWFESTDRATMPPGEMHATIQLDYFPGGGSPQPSEMYVDYMRIYR